jgi:hypothetical protein
MTINEHIFFKPPKLFSTTSLTLFIIMEQKLGHPVPELNFVSEDKGSLQAAQNTRLFVITIKFILKGRSVPFSARYNTDYQLTDFFHSASVLLQFYRYLQ